VQLGLGMPSHALSLRKLYAKGAMQSGWLYAGLFICGVTGKKGRSSSTLYESKPL
jgi:hypothetical protein